jgi:hypothetical protein
MKDQGGGKGGDLAFEMQQVPDDLNNFTASPGSGGEPVGDGERGPDGRLLFKLADGTEVLRFEPDGRVFVRGSLVDEDALVYGAFRAWLSTAIQELR